MQRPIGLHEERRTEPGMMDSASETMGSTHGPLREEYVSRINRVIDYIETHLSEELSLAALAKVACFSPFHFHRIFGAMMGESLNQFIQRVRIEKAATLLVAQPQKSITEVAIDCGFSSSATFARAFKKSFRMSASEWRAGGCVHHRREDRPEETADARAIEMGRRWGVISQRFDEVTRTPQWWIRFMDKEPVLVEVKEMPAFHVAYVRYIGRYQGMAEVFARLFGKLLKWAGPRGFLEDRDAKLLVVLHDNPEVTEGEKLRTSVCITVPAGTAAGGGVGSMTIPGGRYAVGRFRLGEREYADAWYAVMAGWLPDSGYQPDDRLCYELYPIDSDGSCEGKATVDICVPVRPL